MITKIIEAVNEGGINHGKFMIARFDDQEWGTPGALNTLPGQEQTPTDRSIIASRGWGRSSVWVLDLQTGEGALFTPGGYAKADLDKHAIWVCPLYEPFLTWLYGQDLTDLDALPPAVVVQGASALYGYRRPGPGTSPAGES